MNNPQNHEILLVQPRGFCAGVNRAIEIVERALAQFGKPIYVRHEIVHNTYVVATLRNKGVIFIEELATVPAGNIVIFSAHGVSRAVQEEARKRNLIIFDATCPLVTKVHMEVVKMHREGREIVIIGHKGHPEVEGTMGQIKKGIYLVETLKDVQILKIMHSDMIGYVSQTTFSIDDTIEIIAALKLKFPKIIGPKKSDICYATTNRQEAVKFLATQVELVFVVGSLNSSNSNRLCEVVKKNGVPVYMIDHADDINLDWLIGKQRIGITASASAPEFLVQGVIHKLKNNSFNKIRILGNIETHINFAIPKNLNKYIK